MSGCEKCWRDAHGDPYESVTSRYHELLAIRNCTPEEQAGPDAAPCVECGGRMVRHQWTGECMADGAHGFVKVHP